MTPTPANPSGRPAPRWSPVLTLAFVLVLLLAATAAQALVFVGRGNDAVPDRNWPAGSLAVANLKTRFGWWEGPPFGGGQTQFVYRGDTAAFQAALDAFAAVRAPRLELVVHEGPMHSPFFADGDRTKPEAKAAGRLDWSFTVWDPRSFHQLYNNPTRVFSAADPSGAFRGTIDPPRLDVYVGGAPAGQGVDWAKVRVPANVAVTDERASANGYAAGTGSVVKGEAYDLTTSKPVAGARVTLTKNADGKQVEVAAITTDADGRFEVTKVPPGDYQVVATADGRASRTLGYAHFGVDTLKRYVVHLSPAADLKGTVTDDAGRPVANLAVRAESVMAVDGRGYPLPSPPAATTDAHGRFTLAGLPKGYCQVFVSGGGYHQTEFLKVHPVPTEDLSIRLGATGSIGGKVVTPAGGPPKGPYIVNLTPADGNKVGSYGGSATLSPDGTFRFENVPPGRYTVTARPNPGPALAGVDPNAKTVDVVAGRTVEVEIKGE